MEADIGVVQSSSGQERLSKYDAQVFLLDDELAIVTSTAFFLESHGARVCAFTDAQTFLDEVAGCSGPGCVLLDMTMPGVTGIEVQQELSRVAPQLIVVFLTGRATYANCAEAMRLGAFDILQKPLMGAEVIDQIDTYMQEADRQWLARKEKIDFLERYDTLTTREREVYSLMLVGNETKRLAFQLDISVSTAEKHVRNVLRKFRVDSPAKLILASVRNGDLLAD
ncbi:MAG: response regulator transcription factor [Planctomycetaceae bacterium]